MESARVNARVRAAAQRRLDAGVNPALGIMYGAINKRSKDYDQERAAQRQPASLFPPVGSLPPGTSVTATLKIQTLSRLKGFCDVQTALAFERFRARV